MMTFLNKVLFIADSYLQCRDFNHKLVAFFLRNMTRTSNLLAFTSFCKLPINVVMENIRVLILKLNRERIF